MGKSSTYRVKWAEAKRNRLQTVWFHLQEIPRKGKTVEMKQVEGWLGLETWEQGLIAEGMRNILKVVEGFLNQMVLKVAQMHKLTKTH